VIARVKAGIILAFTHPAESIVYRFVQELLEQQRGSEICYAQTVDLLGEAGVTELVALLEYYTLKSMSLNTFEVPVPEGEITPF
jgi:4-carboxymuconolactone decarboxylase